MIDSVALVNRRGAAKTEIAQMAEQLAANLKDRPVAVVWSKADKIDNVRENIRNALEEDLAQVFGDSQVFEVSNFSRSDPDTLCHKNERTRFFIYPASILRIRILNIHRPIFENFT